MCAMSKSTYDYARLRQLLVVAENEAALSTCFRHKVGAVIASATDYALISWGYNEVLRGITPCNQLFRGIYVSDTVFDMIGYKHGTVAPSDVHHTFSNMYEVHAEQMALSRLSPSGEELICVCTLQPCIQCAKMLMLYNVKHVFYKKVYGRHNTEVDTMFKVMGVHNELLS